MQMEKNQQPEIIHLKARLQTWNNIIATHEEVFYFECNAILIDPILFCYTT